MKRFLKRLQNIKDITACPVKKKKAMYLRHFMTLDLRNAFKRHFKNMWQP